MSDAPRRVVFGLGNPARGDDSAGRLVARLLREALPGDVVLVEQDGDAASLVPLLRADDAVWLVDACCSGAPAGTIRRLDCAAGDVPPPASSASSHGLGVAEAVALARALGSLPRPCVLYAIEGADFTPGAPPCAAVVAATRQVAARITSELRDTAGSRFATEDRRGPPAPPHGTGARAPDPCCGIPADPSSFWNPPRPAAPA